MKFYIAIIFIVLSCNNSKSKFTMFKEEDNPFVIGNGFRFIEGHNFENKYYTNQENIGLFTYEFSNLFCPDGLNARFQILADLEIDTTNKKPIVFVFHGGTYDNERGGAWGASHITAMNKLTGVWATYKMRSFLGTEWINTGEGDGSIAGALARKGWSAVFLENCWADMGHNRSVGAQQSQENSGTFYRAGLEAAESIVDEFAASTLIDNYYAWGVSAGGHATYEILNSRKSIISKVVLDSPADKVIGYYQSIDKLVIEGSISEEVKSLFFSTLDDFFLRVFQATSTENATKLSESSLADKLVTDPDFSDKKIYYVYSSKDPIIPLEVSQPAVDQMDLIKANSPSKTSNFCVKKLDKSKHVFSNDNIILASAIISFLENEDCIEF